MTDEWLTIGEAAAHLKMSVPTIRKYISLGKLPSYRQGRIIRLKRSEIDRFLVPGYQTATSEGGGQNVNPT